MFVVFNVGFNLISWLGNSHFPESTLKTRLTSGEEKVVIALIEKSIFKSAPFVKSNELGAFKSEKFTTGVLLLVFFFLYVTQSHLLPFFWQIKSEFLESEFA